MKKKIKKEEDYTLAFIKIIFLILLLLLPVAYISIKIYGYILYNIDFILNISIFFLLGSIILWIEQIFFRKFFKVGFFERWIEMTYKDDEPKK